MTAGKAYKDGVINKVSTFVKLGTTESKIVGFKSNTSDAKKLYGSGNSINYWSTIVKECQEKIDVTVNEVKMQNEDPEAKYNVICDDTMLKKYIKMVLTNRKLHHNPQQYSKQPSRSCPLRYK